MNKKKVYRLNERQKEILKVIGKGMAAGVIVTIAGLFPNLIGAIFKLSDQIDNLKESAYKYKVNESVKTLKKKGLIYLSGEEVKLTKKGKNILKLIKLEDINVREQDIWDSQWHLVSYDIPERIKDKREIFRFHLERLGFHKIQDSLWIFPYECKEEIAIIAQTIGVDDYVIYLNTDDLPQRERLMKKFNLQ